MTADLQGLIEQIRREGVDKAEAEAAQVLARAKERAAEIVKAAETQAAARLKKAETDAQVFTERSIKTLEQAARDVLIEVGHGVENILKRIVLESVGEALTPQVLIDMMLAIVRAYVERGMEENRIEVLISPQDQKKLVALYLEKYRQELVKGVEIRTDDQIIRGFKVSVKDNNLYHDFTREAIADALGQFLRPQLVEIVHRVAGSVDVKPDKGI